MRVTTPIGIDSIDARRLVLDGLLEGLADGFGIVPGRTRIPASHLFALAGTLAQTMRAGDPVRRLSVVADHSLGSMAGDIAAFGGYVGGAVTIEVVDLPADADAEAARIVHALGAVPFFMADVDAIAAIRDRLGASVGIILRPDWPGLASAVQADLPIRVPGPLTAVGPASGVLNLVAAVAMIVEGADVEEIAAIVGEEDRGRLRLERRSMRWGERSIGIASLRAARQRIDGVGAPADPVSLLVD